MDICKVCGYERWEKIYRIKRWDIKKCFSCGFAKIDPFPEISTRPEFFSEEKIRSGNAKKLTPLQQFSRKMKRGYRKIFKREKQKIFLEKLSLLLKPGAKVLDIGCAEGGFVTLCMNAGFESAGIEMSKYLSTRSDDKKLRILEGDFLFYDFGPEKFDGITMISLLEHLPDPEAALKKCFSLLNKEGKLILKTVNFSCVNRFVKGKNWTGFRPPDHLVYFNPKTLSRLLKKVGYKKVRISAWPFNDNMYCDACK